MKQKWAPWPRAVVFDLDGTLADSAGDIRDALNHAFGLRNQPPFSLAEVRNMVGAGLLKLCVRAIEARGAGGVQAADLAADVIEYYSAHLTRHTVLYAGAATLLDRLKGEGRLLGLCTNKRNELTVEVLKELGIASYFSAVWGEREGFPRKPDPEPLLGVLETLGVRPQDAVMVGDGRADIECAKAAGAVGIAVRYGYAHGNPDEFGAAAVIDCLADLPDCLAALGAAKQ
jgi:phosphoglycolate phosphatase